MSDSHLVHEHYIAQHIKEIPKSGIREFFDLVSDMDMSDVISLGVGEPDFATPWTIRESAIFSLERGRTSYTPNLGTLVLRKEICSYVAKNFGLEYDPRKECVVTVGVSEALDIAIRALVNPGEEVIYTEPCFVSYPAEIKMAHGVPVVVETHEEDGFALNPAKLRKVITPKSKVLLINFPCNPTGAVLSEKELAEIAEIAIENDLIVITDEIYSELSFEQQHRSIASMPGMQERTIFLHGFSKAFAMTGWRIGYACGPAKIIDAMMKIHQYSIMCAPTTAQDAAVEALRNGEKAKQKMKESYLERRDLVVDGLNRIGLKCLRPKGTFYVFPNITSTGMSSTEFAKKLLEQEKVAVVPGVAFGKCGEGFLRCCYATAAKDLIVALERIENFLKNNCE